MPPAILGINVTPNPSPGVGLFFTDVQVRIPNPVRRVILTSKNPAANLYIHTRPLKMAVSGNVVTPQGAGEYIPMASTTVMSFPSILLKTPGDLFYVSGDGGGTLPADFNILFSTEIDDASPENAASGGGAGSNVTVTNFPNPQAISAASLPLPTGASTEATLAKLLPTYKTVTSNNGTGGSEATITVPANKRWIVRAYRLNVTTSATAATRTIGVLTNDGTNNISLNYAPQTQTASTTLGFMFAPSLNASAALIGGQSTNGYPEVVLAAGYIIQTNIINRQATDLVNITVDVEEYSV